MGPNTWKWEAGPSEPTDKGVKFLIIKEGHICIQEKKRKSHKSSTNVYIRSCL